MEKKYVAQLQPVGCSAGFDYAAEIAEWASKYDKKTAHQCTVYNARGKVIAVLLRGTAGRWFVAEGALPNDLLDCAFDNVWQKLTVPPYCTQNNGDCVTCSLSSYGWDCRNNPIKKRGI